MPVIWACLTGVCYVPTGHQLDNVNVPPPLPAIVITVINTYYAGSLVHLAWSFLTSVMWCDCN